MSNQAVNSLALISARYTIHSINTLQQLLAWTIYLLCQALDLRALQRRLALTLSEQIEASISKHFSTWIGAADQKHLSAKVFARLNRRMDETSARDLEARLMESYMSAGFELLKFFADLPSGGGADPLRTIMKWRAESVKETHALYRKTTLEVSGRAADWRRGKLRLKLTLDPSLFPVPIHSSWRRPAHAMPLPSWARRVPCTSLCVAPWAWGCTARTTTTSSATTGGAPSTSAPPSART